MKAWYFAAAATVALATQIAPAGAAPHIKLMPVKPADVALSVPSPCSAPAAINGDPYFELPAIALDQGAGGITSEDPTHVGRQPCW